MKKNLMPMAAIALSTIGLSPLSANAATLAATNFDQLNLGAKIVGPLGPNVETTFSNNAGESIGSLSSSVACPTGFASCLPPTNAAGTIYTYVHQVTAGIDFPDRAAAGETSIGFRLNFLASGFNGVAGYSFSEAAAALGDGNTPIVREANNGSLVWRIPDLNEWNKGEKITFFWQTTQNPSGPTGSYGLLSRAKRGTALGPLPTPVASNAIPEPGAIAPLALLSLGLLLKRRVSAA